MVADDFYKEEEKMDENTDQPEVVKIGDKEYTPEQVESLVKLGEIGQELEGKWNTPIDKLMPSYTKTTQENVEMRKKIEELESSRSKEIEEKPNDQLSPEELKEKARVEARNLGIVLDEDVNEKVLQILEARDMVRSTERLLEQAKADGNPTTSVDEVFKYMQETGVKSPDKAYKLMFEDELDKIKEQKLASLKPKGFTTMDGQGAAEKMPERKKVTRDTLSNALGEVLNR